MRTVEFRPFELALWGYGNFGDLWWAGTDDSPALEAVVRRVRRALEEAGIPFDRKRFVPHITVHRGRSAADPACSRAPKNVSCRATFTRKDRGTMMTEKTSTGRY